MTRQRNDNHSTEFGIWLREKYQKWIGSHTFSAQNLDYIWHNYLENWIILIEEKRYGGMMNKGARRAQEDTHGVVAQMLAIASGSVVNTMRGPRKCDYRGYYRIVFENTSPDDGGMTINGEPATEKDLMRLLYTGSLAVRENVA